MVKIKITRGGCGIDYTDANGVKRHTVKTPEDKPFDCDEAQAERLVSLRVAEYVEAPQTVGSGDEDDLDGVDKFGPFDTVELEKMDYNDLKKLAAEIGVKPEGAKKADYIAAIAAVSVEADDLDDEDDDLPDLNAADPE